MAVTALLGAWRESVAAGLLLALGWIAVVTRRGF